MLKKVSWEVYVNFDLPTFFDTLKCSELHLTRIKVGVFS